MIGRAKRGGPDLDFYPLRGWGDGLPMTVKILLEGLTRLAQAGTTDEKNIAALAKWPAPSPDAELPFLPARVLMQDLTGVPPVDDLGAMPYARQPGGHAPRQGGLLVPL